MNVELTGRHLDLTPRIRAYAEEKIGKLGRLVDDLQIHVTLTSEKHRQTCGIVAHGRAGTFTGEVTDDDLFAAITGAVDVLARQLRKKKTDRLHHRREGADSIRHLADDEVNGESSSSPLD